MSATLFSRAFSVPEMWMSTLISAEWLLGEYISALGFRIGDLPKKDGRSLV
jgi:hypothetical protein